jgi:hypothetical protein
VTFRRSALRRPTRPLSSRSGRVLRGRLATVVAAGLLVAAEALGTVPVAAHARGVAAPSTPAPQAAPSAAPQGDTAAGVGTLQPGVQYEELMAHAADRIDFTPGGRVTVPFRPRAGDTWSVGGRAPRALPAGTATGRALIPSTAAAGAATPARPAPASEAPAPSDAPVDAPSNETPPAAADDASARLPAATGDAALDATHLRRQVMGFLPYWEVNDAVLDYNLLSTIAYFSVGADKNGNLLKLDSDGTPTTGWGGWTSSKMTSIINGAHSKGTRVVLTISVMAWSTGQAQLQGALLGNPAARLNLAQQAAAAVRARGADGINLDFEPIATGYDDEYTAFVRTVRSELNKQASGYQLTFDTTGFIGNYPIQAATAPGGADAIFVMGYDYRGSGSTYVGSIDPASGPAYDLQDTIDAYTAKVSPSKLILGLPWYGPGLVDGLRRRQREKSERHEVRLVEHRRRRHRHGLREAVRPAMGFSRALGVGRLPEAELHLDLRLRDDVAPDLLRRRAGDEGPLRPDQPRGPAGSGDLGAGLRRRPDRHAPGDRREVPRRPHRAARRRPGPPADPVGRDVLGLLGRHRRERHRRLRRPGLDRRRAWLDWATHTTATSLPYSGAAGHGAAFRVRARD